MIQRFERHARGQGAVADNGNDPTVLAALRCRDGHAQGRADRGAGVADAECVVFTLGARRERRKPRVLLDGVQLVAPAGKHLVRIGLVSHIPDEPVIGGVEHIMQGNRELHRAQSCRKVPTAGCDALNQKLPQFLRQIGQFCSRQPAQVRRRGDGFEQRIAGGRNVHIAPVYTARTLIVAMDSAGMLRICTIRDRLT